MSEELPTPTASGQEARALRRAGESITRRTGADNTAAASWVQISAAHLALAEHLRRHAAP
jgi:hypothetical protein